jgi:hypothetical protein
VFGPARNVLEYIDGEPVIPTAAGERTSTPDGPALPGEQPGA